MARRWVGLLVVLAVATIGILRGPADASADDGSPGFRSPTELGLSELLPTGDEVPAGLVRTEGRGRTLDEIAANYGDPADAAWRFAAWGWQANVIGSFGPPPGASLPTTATDSLYVSIHRFADAAGADAALDYSLDDQAATTGVREEGAIRLGDATRVLFGQTAARSEITLYVREGVLLIRLTATSPQGDPGSDAFAVAQAILAK